MRPRIGESVLFSRRETLLPPGEPDPSKSALPRSNRYPRRGTDRGVYRSAGISDSAAFVWFNDGNKSLPGTAGRTEGYRRGDITTA